MSRPVPAALLKVAEHSLRGVVAEDDAAVTRLAGLAGRILGVRIRGPEYECFMASIDGAVRLSGSCETVPDVTISGSPADFLMFLRSRGDSTSVFGRLEIQGDLAAAQAWQAFLVNLNVDWEEWLARRVGDVPAHQVARAARSLAGWLGRSERSLEQDLSEYLRYEAELVATREQLEQFYRDVGVLAEDVDRASARLNRIESHRDKAR